MNGDAYSGWLELMVLFFVGAAFYAARYVVRRVKEKR